MNFLNLPSNQRRTISGQERRLRRRNLARSTRRASRHRNKQFFVDRQEAARVRARLQSVGLVSGFTDISPERAYRAALWLIQEYGDGVGEVVIDEPFVRDAFRRGLNHLQRLEGYPPTDLPTGYELPVALG